MQKQQSGFTLIELMIVVAIIGILASVSIPMYRDYIVRTKIATIISTVGSIKTGINIAVSEGKAIPTLAADTVDDWADINMRMFSVLGMTDVSAVTVAATTAVITITLADTVLGGATTDSTIIMTPNFGGSNTTWITTLVSDDGGADSDVETVALVDAYLATLSSGS
jgi:type IV pilus assembly protein PilA